MKMSLAPDQLLSVKRSYLNIVTLFLAREQVESRYFRCLLKWGFQLGIGPNDLNRHADLADVSFSQPVDRAQRIEEIFNLINMIFLDRVVEDVELEVATFYAEKLGFSSRLISEMVTAIATAEEEGLPPDSIRNRLNELLEEVE